MNLFIPRLRDRIVSGIHNYANQGGVGVSFVVHSHLVDSGREAREEYNTVFVLFHRDTIGSATDVPKNELRHFVSGFVPIFFDAIENDIFAAIVKLHIRQNQDSRGNFRLIKIICNSRIQNQVKGPFDVSVGHLRIGTDNA